MASNFGSFFGGFVGPIFTLLSLVLILYTIVNQNLENGKNTIKSNFFKMVDYHNENVKQINIPHIYEEKEHTESERRAFVIYKIQIKRLIQAIQSIVEAKKIQIEERELIDIAYSVFFYGLDRNWKGFVIDKLSRYNSSEEILDDLLSEIESKPEIKIGRSNQTNLSTYFRNMYNAIKLVDNSNYLNDKEKKELIKIYRAQLSNPELYVLFFNLVSMFGKKWTDNNYVIKYELIKNIPKDYCDGIEPKEYYDIVYEHEEI